MQSVMDASTDLMKVILVGHLLTLSGPNFGLLPGVEWELVCRRRVFPLNLRTVLVASEKGKQLAQCIWI